MSEPPKKRLRQASILDSFHRDNTKPQPLDRNHSKESQPQNKTGSSDCIETVGKEAETLEIEDSSDEEMSASVLPPGAGNKSNARDSCAAAAERRRDSGSLCNQPIATASEKNGNCSSAPCPEKIPTTKASSGEVTEKVPSNTDDNQSPKCSQSLEMSPLLFTDSESQGGSQASEQEVLLSKPALKRDESRGISKTSLKTTPQCSAPLPKLCAGGSHTVLVRIPLTDNQVPMPFPEEYRDIWDSEYVRMPCSSENIYPVEGKDGKKEFKNRWQLMKSALLGNRNITSSHDIEKSILSYNARYVNKWDFSGLHTFFMEELEAVEVQHFFKETFPAMVKLAIQLPDICTQPIPLLKRKKLHSITLSQQQIASLLANAFFCTLPRRNAHQKQSEYSSYPDINFSRIFQGSGRGSHSRRKAEKLKCLLHYFRRVTTKMPTGTVTFRRQVLNDFPQWDQSMCSLTELHASSRGTIEDDGLGMLQVDFANKYVGGGVLGNGCVQEEIRFLICPEMIVSRLFTEVLENNECLIMTGCERFSNYTGYADSFRWAGDYEDVTPRDEWGRLYTEVVAIDALVCRNNEEQFKPWAVKRELNKAYCGFKTPGVSSCFLPAVATGNWGCGAFGGDSRLKGLIQCMAAAEVERDVCFYTFQDTQLKDELLEIHDFLKEKKLSLADIWVLIQQYRKQYFVRDQKPLVDLFQYIHSVYRNNTSDTDDDENTGDSQEVSYNNEIAGNSIKEKHEAPPSPDWTATTP